MKGIFSSTVDNKFGADIEEENGQFTVILFINDDHSSVSCGWVPFGRRANAETFASQAKTPLGWLEAVKYATEGAKVIEQGQI